MLKNIIALSVRHKAVVLIGVMVIALSGLFALLNIPIGAVPDVTNNQVQVITTSRHLAAEDVERFLTYPVELQMSNLPGVEEIRSISKFGLSVVTIVFEEDMGTYLPRQLIAEKLVELSKEIPESFGTPTMAPISTGLGEIYQYTLNVAPEHKHRYTLADIRGIQDWIVKRQLSGIPGVVEVNTWGGHLKTFEVIADPKHLFSLGLSLADIYDAVKNSASIEGGGYIEKDNEAHFLRFEGLLKSIDDIENILVLHEDGTPLFIKDIATVKEGYSTRFGAITGNGEGEKVLGQVMMLKGANSQAVINEVRARVEKVQSSLPLGISIDPIVDRSELISRTTWTITENLTLAFVIVFLVVVFLMGNLRAGVIVASVVPLTLLMALGLMYIFKIDANLMSLGAIDFGIIIDGAVIIVEYISLLLMKSSFTPESISQGEKDKLTILGTDKMLHSAIFGQIIILVVFIPILTLTGVEGKMFKPMALTFCFAVISAIILCFTYVPVLASLLLRPGQQSFKITQRVMAFLHKRYEWALMKSMQAKSMVLIVAIASFIAVGFLFSRMGAEFIPTLDEGDFVIQPVLKTGMSLKETVAMTTRIEKILMDFSEVKKVVSRIGAAEVPTDPMSMEESDIIIALHPPTQWKDAHSKDDLADLFKSAIIEEIPGIEVEFTQPIEMRFNELITGVRADIAIKVFGENLDTLFNKGMEIQDLIKDINGAADISVEKIDGLPQMLVSYNRKALGRYGLSLNAVNEMVGTAFGGRVAGQLYEGERQHDVVVRFPEISRNSIEELKSMMIPLADGGYLPLEAIAKVRYTTGPAKISRDDTKRRVVVGINVRGSDLATVVAEVRQRIEDQVSLPPGYTIDYSGQFENLEAASARLTWAVPIALLLIFIFLFFAFNSLQYALIIFTAIPLATIGGILGLYFRGMPFSISAGVGFIALFGIAVLNGIVMIEHFLTNKLNNGMITDDTIVQLAKERLRPVLLTAMAAAMGFLPMALSTSAGAEVQRPLATVVVVGLISSTILTLIILPIIYSWISNKGKKAVSALIGLLLIAGGNVEAQQILDAKKVIQKLDNHPVLEWQKKEVVKAETMIDGVSSFSFPEIYYSYDENNVTELGQPLHVLGIEKSGKLPKWIKVRKDLQRQKINTANANLSIEQFSLNKKIYLLCNNLEYLNAKRRLSQQRDSTVQRFIERTQIKKKNGQSSQDETYRLKLDALNITSTLNTLDREIVDVWSEFYILVQDSSRYEVPKEYLPYRLPESQIYPELSKMNEGIKEIEIESKIVKSNFLPEWRFSIFGGTSNLDGDRFYPALETGLTIPINSKAKKSALSAMRIEQRILEEKKVYRKQQLEGRMKRYEKQLIQLREEMDWYRNEVFPLLKQQSQRAHKSMANFNSDVLSVMTLYEQEFEMQMKYLELIYEHNSATIEMAFPTL